MLECLGLGDVLESAWQSRGKISSNSPDAFQSPMALVVLAAVSVDDAAFDEEDGLSSTRDLQGCSALFLITYFDGWLTMIDD